MITQYLENKSPKQNLIVKGTCNSSITLSLCAYFNSAYHNRMTQNAPIKKLYFCPIGISAKNNVLHGAMRKTEQCGHQNSTCGGLSPLVTVTSLRKVQ